MAVSEALSTQQEAHAPPRRDERGAVTNVLDQVLPDVWKQAHLVKGWLWTEASDTAKQQEGMYVTTALTIRPAQNTLRGRPLLVNKQAPLQGVHEAVDLEVRTR